ncbi:MAG: HDOD domain-containing protein [Alphaproteobacteria bacterium]|nr:HDOD domain-containing protein [Alphaproteobacteria bacterium]
MGIKILIVDNQPKVYQGLKRVLWTQKPDWDLFYAENGQKALELIDEQKFDVIVSDIKMPVMNGSELLNHVYTKHPDIIRIVLSGQCDQDSAFKLVSTTHLFLAKPCDHKTFTDFIERAMKNKLILNNPDIIKIINGIQNIPSMPYTYLKLNHILEQKNVNVNTIVDIISNDVALAAKILQMVNSAFFSLNWRVTNLNQAIHVLGIDTLKMLVLSYGLIQKFEVKQIGKFSTDILWQENINVAFLAKELAIKSNESEDIVEEVFVSSLLLKIGILLLAQNYYLKFEEALKLAIETSSILIDVEKDLYACSHAEIGAYLLSIWGLPSEIVETVALHMNPRCEDSKTSNILKYAHYASSFIGASSKLIPNPHAQLKTDFIEFMKIEKKINDFDVLSTDFLKNKMVA